MFLNIVKYPSSMLRNSNEEIKEVTQKVKDLVLDMIETMHKSDGAGLAAPQIGINKKIIVVDWKGNDMVFINPKIIRKSWKKYRDTEGCLSFPGLEAEVKRSHKILITAIDYDGKIIKASLDGLLARILQHEIDHLNGVLLIDKVSNQVKADYEKSIK